MSDRDSSLRLIGFKSDCPDRFLTNPRHYHSAAGYADERNVHNKLDSRPHKIPYRRSQAFRIPSSNVTSLAEQLHRAIVASDVGKAARTRYSHGHRKSQRAKSVVQAQSILPRIPRCSFAGQSVSCPRPFWHYGLPFDGGSPCFAASVEASLAPSLSTMTCANPLVTSKATRRFWARPSAVALLAIGLASP
jgi:hypothetical protein